MALDADLDGALLLFDLETWLLGHGFDYDGRGDELVGDCPFCGAEGKFSVNPEKRKWRCFVGAHRVKLLHLIAELEGGVHEAVELVLASIRVSATTLPELVEPRESKVRPFDWEPQVISPPPYFIPLHSQTAYTAHRRWDDQALQAFGVGICVDGRCQDRIVFPVRALSGEWIYYQGRATWEKEHDVTGHYRKSLNPTPQETDTGSADVLMGLELAWPLAVAGRRITVVEGPGDMLRVGPGAVPLLGRVISERQLALLAKAATAGVDLFPDGDSWVQKPGTTKPPPAIELAAKVAAVCGDVRVIQLPPEIDPDDLHPGQVEAWRATAKPWQSRLATI